MAAERPAAAADGTFAFLASGSDFHVPGRSPAKSLRRQRFFCDEVDVQEGAGQGTGAEA